MKNFPENSGRCKLISDFGVILRERIIGQLGETYDGIDVFHVFDQNVLYVSRTDYWHFREGLGAVLKSAFPLISRIQANN
jgi:hypothetical protein